MAFCLLSTRVRADDAPAASGAAPPFNKVQTVYGGKCTHSNGVALVIGADTAVGFFARSYDGDVPDFMDNCWG
jgi:hypothetical protein